MNFEFKQASKENVKFKITIAGPSGAGKTFTALNIAHHLGGKTAVVDTERGKSQFYSDEFDFQVVSLKDYHPNNLIALIDTAVKAGFDNLIIDSFSHFWMGKNGVLEQIDNLTAKYNKDSRAAWRVFNPTLKAQYDYILDAPINIILTLRSKAVYLETINEKGKKRIEKAGSAPVQKEDFEYEFDLNCTMDMDHTLFIDKTRFRTITSTIFRLPGENIVNEMKLWASKEGNLDRDTRNLPTFGEATIDNVPLVAVKETTIVTNKPVPEPAPKDNSIVGLITYERQRQLWSEAQGYGHNADSAKAVLASKGLTSFKDIPMDRYEEIRIALTSPSGIDGLVEIPVEMVEHLQKEDSSFVDLGAGYNE